MGKGFAINLARWLWTSMMNSVDRKLRFKRPGSLLLLFLTCISLAACASQQKPPANDPLSSDDPLSNATRAELREMLGESENEKKLLESQNAEYYLKLVEQETLMLELREHVNVLQKELDGTVNEVVRSKARMQSMESRAEAASALAEAEITMREMEQDSRTSQLKETVKTGNELLTAANAEFKKENYSGALYLVSRIKSLTLPDLNASLSSEYNPGQELGFTIPLKLQLKDRSNLRKGPGLNYAIIQVLDRGSFLTGLASWNDWIRVKTDKNVSGWVYYQLVTKR